MDINQYSELALRTAKSLGSQVNDAMHAAAGMAGESGEVIDIVKKSFAYGKTLDRDHLIEEIGDGLWYANLMIHTLGSSWEEVLSKNIAKLKARYPDGYNDMDALNRDKQAEQSAMSSIQASFHFES